MQLLPMASPPDGLISAPVCGHHEDPRLGGVWGGGGGVPPAWARASFEWEGAGSGTSPWVYCPRLQRAAPIGPSPSAALPLGPPPP